MSPEHLGRLLGLMRATWGCVGMLDGIARRLDTRGQDSGVRDAAVAQSLEAQRALAAMLEQTTADLRDLGEVATLSADIAAALDRARAEAARRAGAPS